MTAAAGLARAILRQAITRSLDRVDIPTAGALRVMGGASVSCRARCSRTPGGAKAARGDADAGATTSG
ncbi:hypothetical protein B1H18_30620 [Streptomyces tsukubensis]|uniref:Uncharacterized protein n=1 Tax=Streptomyces tsukubensis TaxID=83656 RepID=A0A1V4A0V5_9ACTN|nr:hypothetical protein B1H18_30620 [Streptomyces tsukubensis]